MHPPQRRGPSPPARPPPTRSAAAAIRSSACWPSGSSESAWAASADTNASAQSALRGHGAGRGGAELGKAGLGWPPFLAPWLPSRAALACRGTPHSCIHAPQRSTAATAAARLVHAGWLGFAPPSCPQQAQHRAVAPRSKAHTRAAPAPAPASLTPRSHEEHPPQRLQVLQHLQLLEEVPALSGENILGNVGKTFCGIRKAGREAGRQGGRVRGATVVEGFLSVRGRCGRVRVQAACAWASEPD